MKTKKEIVRRLNNVVSLYQELDTFVDKLDSVLGPQEKLCDHIFKTFEAYVAAVEEVLDLRDSGWIFWFLYDNECGKKKRSAGLTNSERIVKNTSDMADVILDILKSRYEN